MFARRFWQSTKTFWESSKSNSWEDIAKSTALGTAHVVNFVCGVHLFMTYVGRPTAVSGPSMLPTMAPEGEVCVEFSLLYRLGLWKPARGDLVTLTSPIHPDRVICKRVIGLEGDVVCVDPTGLKAPSDQHVVIPRGHIWIMGDNAAYSRDSRDYGPVSTALLRGTMLGRVWPPQSIAIFPNTANSID